MSIQIVLTVENEDFRTAAAELRSIADRLSPSLKASATAVEAPKAAVVKKVEKLVEKEEPKPRGRPPGAKTKPAEVAPKPTEDDGYSDFSDEPTEGYEGNDAGTVDLNDFDEFSGRVEVTLEKVIDAAKLYAKGHSREAAAAILKRFGVSKLNEIPPAQFKLVYEAFNA